MSERVIGFWLNDADLAEACRRRADELGKSYDEIDSLANLARGHTSKVLAVPQKQRFGPISRYAIPWALEMKFGLVEDRDAARQCKRRVDNAVRRGKAHGSHTKYLALAQELGRQGARKMLENIDREHLSRIRRKAAKARWRKARLAQTGADARGAGVNT